MLLPRMDKVSSACGSRLRAVILTVLRCVFICMSTPVIVPWTTEPFFSSMVTVSLFSFIKNLPENKHNIGALINFLFT